jgi:hypothetical protein
LSHSAIQKGCIKGVTITGSNIFHAHAQYFMRDAIFIVQVCFEYFRIIVIVCSTEPAS